MNLPVAAILFTLYTAAGWVMDSVWRTLTDGKLERGGFSFLPLCPVYGVGAFVALGIDALTYDIPLPIEVLIIGIALTALEYVTGRAWHAIAGHRLWEYENTPLNLGGHTDLFHFFLWCTCGFLLIRYVNPWLLGILA